MRVSLYKHELEVVERMTGILTRMAIAHLGTVDQFGNSNRQAEVIGPQIFAALLDAMYARGNYEHPSYPPLDITLGDPVFSEVGPLSAENGA